MPETVLSIDLGAESGRVVAVEFNGTKIRLKELHRFANIPVTVNGTMHWNILELWRDIQTGIENGKSLKPASLGVDTWGVDFALLDRSDNLVGNPVHYRDSRTNGVMEQVFEKISQKDIFSTTGIQFMQINTLYQLVSMVEQKSRQLEIADTFLTIPDLLNFWLTGTKVCEFTNATTTQMFNPTLSDWAVTMLSRLSIPTSIFPDTVIPGTKLGAYEGIDVIAPACHDTGSAVAAVAANTSNFAYISSGTWSLVGLELDRPNITQEALAANVTNEGGVYKTYRLLKNVMGLWILQQCRRVWQNQGNSYTYENLSKIAQKAPVLKSIINPNDPRFLPHGDHVQHILNFCNETKQPVPEDPAAITRCILESLALAYREVLEKLELLQGKKIEAIHIIGGGAKNDLLNQLTSDATGIPVIAGPAEATVIGNALVQLISLGVIKNLEEGRSLVAQMDEIKRYEPADKTPWDEAYAKYKQLIGN